MVMFPSPTSAPLGETWGKKRELIFFLQSLIFNFNIEWNKIHGAKDTVEVQQS